MDAQAILVAIIGSSALSTVISLIVGQINKVLDRKSGFFENELPYIMRRKNAAIFKRTLIKNQ